MTLIDDLNSLGHVTVTGSAQYPVLSLSESHGREGPDGLSGEQYRKITWRIRSAMLASPLASLPAALETLQSQLARRGLAVTITEVGGAPRVMPAGGAASGSRVGYPRVSVEMLPDGSSGGWQYFDIIAETLIPLPDGGNLVEHTWSRDTDIDESGYETVSQSGRVVMANGVNARDWAETNVIDPARTANETAGKTFIVRWTETQDPTTVAYQFGDGSTDPSGGIEDIEEAEITDRTVITNGGRVTRTLSGSVKGEDAVTYAAGLRPTPGALEILTVDEVSQPRVPDGRVDFRFELLTGRTDAGFPSVRVLSYNEQISEARGGAEAEWREYLGASPVIWSGPERTYIYQQRSRLEFIGDWSNAVLTPRLSSGAYMTAPRITRSQSERGIKTVEAVFTYAFTAAGTLPAPYEPTWT